MKPEAKTKPNKRVLSAPDAVKYANQKVDLSEVKVIFEMTKEQEDKYTALLIKANGDSKS